MNDWSTPLWLMGALGSYSKSLPRSGVTPTSLARVPGRPQKSPVGEFRISPKCLLCSVSLPSRATGGVGVDERVEGASGRPPWFVLLDVDQVEQAAPIRPLVDSPTCLEGVFSEVRVDGVLRSSHQPSGSGIMLMVERVYPH